jgi:hypothetical protein
MKYKIFQPLHFQHKKYDIINLFFLIIYLINILNYLKLSCNNIAGKNNKIMGYFLCFTTRYTSIWILFCKFIKVIHTQI